MQPQAPSQHNHDPIEGFVLCGGASRRMGTDKAFLKLNGAPMALHVAQQMLEFGCCKVHLIGKSPKLAELGFDVIFDSSNSFHPLQGVHLALEHANFPNILTAPCDVPFVSAEMFQALRSKSPPAYIKGHPLIAHLSKS